MKKYIYKFFVVVIVLCTTCKSKHDLISIQSEKILINSITVDSCLVAGKESVLHFNIENKNSDSIIIEYFTLGNFQIIEETNTLKRQIFYEPDVYDNYHNTLGVIGPKDDTTITLICSGLYGYEKFFEDSCTLRFGNLTYYRVTDTKLKKPLIQQIENKLRVKICK